MVTHDYMVAYEGSCDPVIHDCFIGCVDDECSEEYYYTKVQKYAPDIFAQCGDDITDCENASVCLPQGDTQCSLTYCDPETEGDACEFLIEEDLVVSGDGESTDKVDAPQDEIINDNEL